MDIVSDFFENKLLTFSFKSLLLPKCPFDEDAMTPVVNRVILGRGGRLVTVLFVTLFKIEDEEDDDPTVLRLNPPPPVVILVLLFVLNNGEDDEKEVPVLVPAVEEAIPVVPKLVDGD
jgi:hypothetical protein